MPNWCSNWGNLWPYNEEGWRIFEKLKRYGNFNPNTAEDKTIGWMSLVLPCPKEMWLGVKESKDSKDVEVREQYFSLEWLQENSEFKGDFGIITANKFARREFEPSEEYRQYLLKTFGACNWEEWNSRHWGCKWDVFPDEFEVIEDENIVFRFSSAWVDPMKFFDWLRKHGLNFERWFEETIEGFYGFEEALEGEIVGESLYEDEEYHLYKIEVDGDLVEDRFYLENYFSYEDFIENGNFFVQNEKLLKIIEDWYADSEDESV